MPRAKGKGAPAIHHRCALAAGDAGRGGKETSKPSACRRASPPCQIAIAEVGAVHSLAPAERPVFRPPPAVWRAILPVLRANPIVLRAIPVVGRAVLVVVRAKQPALKGKRLAWHKKQPALPVKQPVVIAGASSRACHALLAIRSEYVPKVPFQRRGAEVKWEARRGKKGNPSAELAAFLRASASKNPPSMTEN